MRFPTRTEVYHWIRGIAQHEDQDIGKPVVRQPGVSKAIIPAAYTSGNPKIQQFWESSTTLGSKLHKVTQLYSNRSGAPAASDSIAIGHDPDGNKVILGKLVDVGSAIVDSDYWMGLRPVIAGNTLLLSANTERSVLGTTPAEVKKFLVTRPGKYRIKLELSKDGGGAVAAVTTYDNSAETINTVAQGSATSAGTYPTFNQNTVDFTTTVAWNGKSYISVTLSNTGAFTAYIKNVTVNYADATAAFATGESVLTD